MQAIRNVRSTAALLSLGAWLVANPAAAQLHDHLKCYKVHDTTSFAATVDLRPADDAIFAVDAGCKVKARSRQLCVPVEKDLVASNGNQLDVAGQELTNAFLCYGVKCPSTTLPAALQMSDQFGTRTLTGLRTFTICAPAISGVPVTTTTTTLPHGPPRDCVNATAPNCDGTCGNENYACIADVGACICQGQEPFAQCGLIAGPPNCYGTCSGSQSCIEVSGACQCGDVFE